MDRQQQLTNWLETTLNAQPFTLTVASADASFRRYFRVHLPNEYLGHKTLVAMDAPPPQEDCRPFVRIAKLLLDAGLNVPTVLAEDVENGFLLLSDLGDATYLSVLNTENAPALYADATEVLVKLQLATQADALPPYDHALLMREM